VSDPIDALDAKIQREGAYDTKLDRAAMRRIVKAVHLKHYPMEFLTDYEADRVIEVMEADTIEYLMQRHRIIGLG
jgi:hypothetical protein